MGYTVYRDGNKIGWFDSIETIHRYCNEYLLDIEELEVVDRCNRKVSVTEWKRFW